MYQCLTVLIVEIFITYTCVLVSQTWSVKSGDSLAVISGSGLGVKPVMFFQDSYKLASAQEKGVLVCFFVIYCPNYIVLFHTGVVRRNG